MVPLDRMQSIGLEFLYNKVGAIDQTLLNSDKKELLDLCINTNKTICGWIRICVLTDRDIIFLDCTIFGHRNTVFRADVIDLLKTLITCQSAPLAMV